MKTNKQECLITKRLCFFVLVNMRLTVILIALKLKLFHPVFIAVICKDESVHIVGNILGNKLFRNTRVS